MLSIGYIGANLQKPHKNFLQSNTESKLIHLLKLIIQPGKQVSLSALAKSSFILASTALSLNALSAETPSEKITVVKAAHMLDTRNGTTLDHAVILIKGERITAAGSNLAIPANAAVIDLGDMTVLPGMIDAHTHLTSNPEDAGYSSVAISVPRMALDWREERPAHAGGGLHHRQRRVCRRVFRCRVA